MDNPKGDYEIFTIEPNGPNLTQLTRNATDDRTPEWSADGERIAYAGHDGNDYEIYTMSMVAGSREIPTEARDPEIILSDSSLAPFSVTTNKNWVATSASNHDPRASA